jgi:hypothetical protein
LDYIYGFQQLFGQRWLLLESTTIKQKICKFFF